MHEIFSLTAHRPPPAGLLYWIDEAWALNPARPQPHVSMALELGKMDGEVAPVINLSLGPFIRL